MDTVYVTRRIPSFALQMLEDAGTILEQWDEERPVPRRELLLRIGEADGLFCMADDRIDQQVLNAADRLRVISTASAGYEHIDLPAAWARGITVCHAPGAAERAVADMTMALLLACARRVVEADHFTRSGAWEYWYPGLLQGADVQGSALGLIGLGRVGMLVAHRALGFGMRVLYHDWCHDEDAEEHLGLQYGALDDVLREADFVSIHLPLRPDTRGLIDAARLRLMKPTAFLINISHGAIINQDALVQALGDHQIAGAGLDDFAQEPLPPESALRFLPNVVLTPHISASTRSGIVTMARMAAEQLLDALQGRTPPHAVLPPEAGQQAA